MQKYLAKLSSPETEQLYRDKFISDTKSSQNVDPNMT
jgi:hypothetical protein